LDATLSAALNPNQTADFGRGGVIAHLNHAGRYTLARHDQVANWETAVAINSSGYHINNHAQQYLRTPTLIGLETVNKFDVETHADRILWDGILSNLMPLGRPVWSFSNDDAHAIAAVGFSYNIHMLPELSFAELRYSMETGSFFAFARTDKQYGVYAGEIRTYDWQGGSNDGPDICDGVGCTGCVDCRHQPVLDMRKPHVNSIVIGENETGGQTITVNASIIEQNGTVVVAEIDQPTGQAFTIIGGREVFTGGSQIHWYADGVRIHTGKTIDLVEHQLSIFNYVRALVITDVGVIHVQPFGLYLEEDEPAPFELVSVNTDIAEITVASGAAATEHGLRLPAGTIIKVEGGVAEAIGKPIVASGTSLDFAGSRNATIVWDLSNLDYNPASIDEQIFEVTGTLKLPRWVINPEDISLDVSVTVKVTEKPIPTKLIPIVEFGEAWDYIAVGWDRSPLTAEHPFLTAPLVLDNMPSALTSAETGDGWAKDATAPIGFGNVPASLPAFADGTLIPNESSFTGQNILHGDSRRWSAYAYKTTFDLPDDFEITSDMVFGGIHRASSGFIMLVNGVEVYRYSVGPSTTGNTSVTLGANVNFNATRAADNSDTAAANRAFTIRGERLTVPTPDRITFQSAAVWSQEALTDALQPGTNVVTIIQSRGQGTGTISYFDLEFGFVVCDDYGCGACNDCQGIFVITFNPNQGNWGGSVANQTRTTTGGEIEDENLPLNPTRDNFAFNGWWTTPAEGGEQITDFSEFTGRVTLFARWVTLPTVTFNLNYTGAPANFTRVTASNGILAITEIPVNPEREGYTFNGWFTAAEGGTLLTLATHSFTAANTTVFAQWTETGGQLSNAALITHIRGNAVTWAGGDGATAATPKTVTINVANSVTSITTNQITLSEGASAEITSGGTNFTVGSNNIVNITVTAEDGTEVFYRITVNRASGGGGGPTGGPSVPSTGPVTPPPVTAALPGAPVTLPANFAISSSAVEALRGTENLPVAPLRVTAAGNQTVSFSTVEAGQNAILVRINPETGELEVVSAATIGANGQAVVNAPGAGDYLVFARKTGDITGTGKVETTDALALLRHIAGIAPLNAVELFAANGQIGESDTTDALNILRFIAGIIDKL
jgi:uncharacterized repeat protein (TIGR02543 family)